MHFQSGFSRPIKGLFCFTPVLITLNQVHLWLFALLPPSFCKLTSNSFQNQELFKTESHSANARQGDGATGALCLRQTGSHYHVRTLCSGERGSVTSALPLIGPHWSLSELLNKSSSLSHRVRPELHCFCYWIPIKSLLQGTQMSSGREFIILSQHRATQQHCTLVSCSILKKKRFYSCTCHTNLFTFFLFKLNRMESQNFS